MRYLISFVQKRMTLVPTLVCLAALHITCSAFVVMDLETASRIMEVQEDLEAIAIE